MRLVSISQGWFEQGKTFLITKHPVKLLARVWQFHVDRYAHCLERLGGLVMVIVYPTRRRACRQALGAIEPLLQIPSSRFQS